MRKAYQPPKHYQSLSEVLKDSGFAPPQHPLLALLNGIDKSLTGVPPRESHVLNFYKITFKPDSGGNIKYGLTNFDFREGGMFFAAPQQLIAASEHPFVNDERLLSKSQITLLIHPDFLLGYPLSKKIKQYNFFSYAVTEALHLSAKEKALILMLFRNMEEEMESRIDEVSHDVLISQIELLLSYAQRFYKRQFLTRKAENHHLITKFETLLEAHFAEKEALRNGVPSVNQLADQLHISPGYLSDMLRSTTGQNAQQHIHQKVIDLAKEMLSVTNLSVAEIAFELGFEQPQSLSRLFKLKTKITPQEFRSAFN